jgi:hypothetical protein
MPNEIYHKSNWGNANAGEFGDVYFDAAATNKLYNHSDYYENSDGTDKILRDLSNKASIVLTPTAYSDGSLNTVIPPYQVLPQELVTNGDFSNGTTSWTPNTNATLTIDNGRLKVAISGAGSGYPSQSITTVVGKKYKITADAFIGTATKVSLYSAAFGFNDLTADGSYNLTFTATSASTQIRLYVYGDGTFGFWDNISIKEIQEADFDFSRGSSATRVNEQGLIESIASGLPRIDYSSGFGSLLLEPQRANVVTQSVDFSSWNAFRATLTDNATTSPDGASNAAVLTEDTTSNSHPINNSFSTSSGVSYTFSIFVKKGSRRYLQIFALNGGNPIYYDLENKSVGSGGSVEDYGSGWLRLIYTYTTNSTSAEFYIQPSINGTSVIYTGDGSSAVYLYGAQLEQGSYATSYIPTNGSTVTRSADVANNSGNADLFNDSEGVLYAEIAALYNDGTNRSISISDSTGANRIELRLATTDDRIQYNARTSSVTQASIFTDAYDVLDYNKIAVVYKDNDFRLFVNGTQVATDTSGSAPTGLKELAFDLGDGSNDFYGNTKELAVFKEALTDAELESLTSWVSFTEMATDLEYTLE